MVVVRLPILLQASLYLLLLHLFGVVIIRARLKLLLV